MGWKIIWTEPALDDLAAAIRYIAADNSDAAVSVGDKIVDHVDVLSAFPEIGPLYRRRPSGDIREILTSPFRVFYRIKRRERLVEILHVWHAAREESLDL